MTHVHAPNQIRLEWPHMGGSGPPGRVLLVAALLALTHLRYPDLPADDWLQLVAVVLVGLGLSGAPLTTKTVTPDDKA